MSQSQFGDLVENFDNKINFFSHQTAVGLLVVLFVMLHLSVVDEWLLRLIGSQHESNIYMIKVLIFALLAYVITPSCT